MWHSLWLLYQREMRSTLRERNVLLYVVVVPLLLYPFLLWLAIAGFSLVAAEEERTPVRVVITPYQPDLARALERQRSEQHLILVQSANPQSDLYQGLVDALIQVDRDQRVTLLYDGRFRQSRRAQRRLGPLIQQYREVCLEKIALEGGVTLSELQPLYLGDVRNETGGSDVGRFVLGTFLPLTLLLMLSLGGLYPAVEMTAGEHERQTHDTTLGLCVPRWQIVLSKYAVVASLCCLSGSFNLLALTVSVRSIIQPISQELANSIQWGWSWFSLGVVLTGIFVMSLMVAAATMLVTAHTRSFRQGQAATTPLFMAVLLPALAVVDRSTNLSWHTSMIPVLNVALLWRDSLLSQVPWHLALATWFFSLAWVALALLLLTLRLQGWKIRRKQSP